MPKLSGYMELIIIIACCSAFIQMFSAMLQGAERHILASILQNVTVTLPFLLFMVVAMFIESLASIDNYMVIYLILMIISVVICMFVWFDNAERIIVPVFHYSKSMKSALPSLFISTLMLLSAQLSGQFAVAQFLSSQELALFAASQKASTIITFILIAVNVVVAPKFSKAFINGNLRELDKIALSSSKIIILLAVPIFFILSIFSESVLSLFGNEYIESKNVFLILLIGQSINVVTGSVGYLLNMTGHEKDFRNVLLFSGPISILLSFLLTSYFGIIGAAIATAMAISLQNLLALIVVKKRLGFNTLNFLRKT
jgi:O-antigen/teichoic acid export membrane protein